MLNITDVKINYFLILDIYDSAAFVKTNYGVKCFKAVNKN